ncbi:MAG: type II toxin-antitoxin system HicA family toxin [Pseudomonadota bacterium]
MKHRDHLDSVLSRLGEAKSAIRCSELTSMLQELGFEVRDAKKQGHKVYVHDGLPSFTSDSFTCGHGKNPEIKSAYITKIIRKLRGLETELLAYLRGKENEH